MKMGTKLQYSCQLKKQNLHGPTYKGGLEMKFLWYVGEIVGFPSDSAVKNRPAMQETQETWVRFLGWEDPLEEGMETLSKILAWKIPRTEEPGKLQSIRLQTVRQN